MTRRRGLALAIVVGAATAVLASCGATASEPARYVALGSSFAAGPGIPDQIPGTEETCRRSTNNYPHQVANRLGLTLTDVSCGGATTDNILTEGQYGQPPQIEAVTAETDLVTITIGGNDISYVSSLFGLSCQNARNAIPPAQQSAFCRPVDRRAIEQSTPTVEGKITDVVNTVRQRAPQAQVLLVNYLTIVPPTGTTTCPTVPLAPEELAFEQNLAERLRQATARAAGSTGATLVDAAEASADRHACAAQPWMLGWVAGSAYHPNLEGMTAVADLVSDAVRNGGVVEVNEQE